LDIKSFDLPAQEFRLVMKIFNVLEKRIKGVYLILVEGQKWVLSVHICSRDVVPVYTGSQG
jgi:hypothetical protein